MSEMANHPRVLVLELLTAGAVHGWYARRVKIPNFAGIMAQSVAAWCEDLGAEVSYRTFTGGESPASLLRGDWDVAFLSSYTRTAWVAYSIANILRKCGTVVALGGPHARAYPADAARFCDYVLALTDKDLVSRVLEERCQSTGAEGTCLSALRHPSELPGLRRRARFVRSALAKAAFAETVPVLASLGCPYTCDFCSDAATPLQNFDPQQVTDDVRAAIELFPGALVLWHDPNFGIPFDEVLDALERGVAGRRCRFGAQSSLSVLTSERMRRLGRAGFIAMFPGIESWSGYENKQGNIASSGRARMEATAERINELVSYVPYVQVNLILGLQADADHAMLELTKEFVARTPGAWPNANMFAAYGLASPLSRQLAKEGRILPIPFPLVDQKTCPTARVSDVDAVQAFKDAVEVMEVAGSLPVMMRRLGATAGWKERLIHMFRAYGGEQRARLVWYRSAIKLLDHDFSFRAFFEGETKRLPDALCRLVLRRLGRWIELLPPELSDTLRTGKR
jgi:hypothetical protein